MSTAIIIAGESGTGKSSLCLSLVEACGGRSLVVNAHSEYSDPSVFTHAELSELPKLTFAEFRTIVIEDIGFPSAAVTRTINRLVTYVRRHDCVNIFMITHALSGNCLSPLIPHFCYIVIPHGEANRTIFFKFVKSQAKEFLLCSESIWSGFLRESIGASLVFSTQTRELSIAANGKELLRMTAKRERMGDVVPPCRGLQTFFRTYYVCENQAEKESALVLAKFLENEVKICDYLDSGFNLEFCSSGARLRCNILDLIKACCSKNRTPTTRERMAFKAVCELSDIPKLLVKNLSLKDEGGAKSETSSSLREES